MDTTDVSAIIYAMEFSVAGALLAHTIQPDNQCNRCKRKQKSLLLRRGLFVASVSLLSSLAVYGINKLLTKSKK